MIGKIGKEQAQQIAESFAAEMHYTDVCFVYEDALWYVFDYKCKSKSNGDINEVSFVGYPPMICVDGIDGKVSLEYVGRFGN